MEVLLLKVFTAAIVVRSTMLLVVASISSAISSDASSIKQANSCAHLLDSVIGLLVCDFDMLTFYCSS